MPDSLPPWRSPLAAAIYRNRAKPYSRYFQLATVTPEGYPANRTVVFRGFRDDAASSLKIITDSRSSKIKDLTHQAIAEVCWYFTKTREQFRLTGNLQIITASENNSQLLTERQLAWKNLSDSARSQFAASNLAVTLGDQSTLAQNFPAPDLPLDTFDLLLFIPYKVDHLQLRINPQRSCLYNLEANGMWSINS